LPRAGGQRDDAAVSVLRPAPRGERDGQARAPARVCSAVADGRGEREDPLAAGEHLVAAQARLVFRVVALAHRPVRHERLLRLLSRHLDGLQVDRGPSFHSCKMSPLRMSAMDHVRRWRVDHVIDNPLALTAVEVPTKGWLVIRLFACPQS
jgi:hypothetical protein